MSIATLVQVYDETRRLAIAGSAVAPGDFRLKKLVAPLEQAGLKAPVFAKVAQAVQAVVDSNEKTASAALLELTTLVNAILYTQGETGAAGDLQPLETTDLGGEVTQASARILKPLFEALASTGSGRLELIRDAIDRGSFKDLRLVKPALFAIDDPYSEISDLIIEKALPLYGKAILPELRAKINVKEHATGHQNRLRLMHVLDPLGSRDIVQLALSEGSKEMKVVAVECLGTADEDLDYLLDQATAKAKDVRAAALRALIASGSASPKVLATLQTAISGDDLELIVQRLRGAIQPAVHDFVLQQAQQQFAETLKCKDVKLQGPAITRMQELVVCLDGRNDPPAEAFLLHCFANAKTLAAIKSEPSGADLNELVAHVMSTGAPALRRALLAAQQKLSGNLLASAIHAARTIMTPAEFFNEFSPELKGWGPKRAKKESDRGTVLVNSLMSGTRRSYRWYASRRYDQAQLDALPELDPRWLDVAIETQDVDLVCRLAHPGHAALNRFLSEQAEKLKKGHESTELLQTMVRIGHPAAADAIIEEIKFRAAQPTHYYVGYWYGRLIADLPKSAHPKFEAFLPTLPEKMIDQLMDFVLALKNKTE